MVSELANKIPCLATLVVGSDSTCHSGRRLVDMATLLWACSRNSNLYGNSTCRLWRYPDRSSGNIVSKYSPIGNIGFYVGGIVAINPRPPLAFFLSFPTLFDLLASSLYFLFSLALAKVPLRTVSSVSIPAVRIAAWIVAG
ncbi:hypothetical protein Tco_0026412 [Tanacetum coccineum]